MEKTVVRTDRAASGKVPLSQAIAVGQWLYCSGQLPLDPATGDLVAGGVAEQTHQVIRNLKFCFTVMFMFTRKLSMAAK